MLTVIIYCRYYYIINKTKSSSQIVTINKPKTGC